MIKKLICWVVLVAVSFAIEHFEAFPMTSAFFLLHAGLPIVSLLVLLIVCAIGKEAAMERLSHILIWLLQLTIAIAITIGISYAANMFLGINFRQAYMLASFPIPFVSSPKQKWIARHEASHEPADDESTDDEEEDDGFN